MREPDGLICKKIEVLVNWRKFDSRIGVDALKPETSKYNVHLKMHIIAGKIHSLWRIIPYRVPSVLKPLLLRR